MNLRSCVLRSLACLAVLGGLAGAAPPARDDGRLLVDPDTSVIAGDLGNRMLAAVASVRPAVDRCLEGLAPLVDARLAPSTLYVTFDRKGRIKAVGRPGEARTAPVARIYRCVRTALARANAGPSERDRDGHLELKASPPLERGAAEVGHVVVSGKGAGVEVALTARRTMRDARHASVDYEVVVTNTGRRPRGVREHPFYVNTVAEGRHSFVASFDTSLAITCLAPGASKRFTHAEREAISAGGGYAGEPFVVTGDCVAPATKVYVGGIRLEWLTGEPAPRLTGLPHWRHLVTPLVPREPSRY